MNTIRTNLFTLTAAAVSIGSVPMAIWMKEPAWLAGLFAICLFL